MPPVLINLAYLAASALFILGLIVQAILIRPMFSTGMERKDEYGTVVTIALALFPFPQLLGPWFHWVNGVTMTIAVVLTIASGIDYVVNFVRSGRTARAAGQSVPEDGPRG